MQDFKVEMSHEALQQAAAKGADGFVEAVRQAILSAIGGTLDGRTMGLLNSDQITLLAYFALRDEVMDGGFVQLIHNGLGGFVFLNPLAKALQLWGLEDLSRLLKKAHPLYKKHREEIEKDCSDEEFMALFEKFPCFDDFDDKFVEAEELWTDSVAHYVDEHLEKFVSVN